jgi:hypothetical protein
MRTILFIATLLLYPAFGYSQELLGTVIDKRKEPLINASVTVMQGGITRGKTITDYDGRFSIKLLPPGIYDAVASYTGYQSLTWTGVIIAQGEKTEVNFSLNIIDSAKPQIAPTYARQTGKIGYRQSSLMISPEIRIKPTTSTIDLVTIPSILTHPYISTEYKATYIVDAKPEINLARRKRLTCLFARH